MPYCPKFDNWTKFIINVIKLLKDVFNLGMQNSFTEYFYNKKTCLILMWTIDYEMGREWIAILIFNYLPRF
jgi:hypothetical protein